MADHGEEAGEWMELALLADAFSGLNHAVNNHLNGMLLQAAALRLRVPQEHREGLDRIRTEGMQAANLFRPLGQFRQRIREKFTPVDFGRLLGAALEARSDKKWTLAAADKVTIPATPGALTRFLRYVFDGLADTHQGSKPAPVTLTAGPPVKLTLELAPRDEEARLCLQRLAEGREHELSLTLLAILSLLRLLEGRLELTAAGKKSKLEFTW